MVLLVDDDPAFLELARRRLDLGREVLFAANAGQARDLMRAVGQEFAVALVDLVLPGEDGVSLIRELHEKFPDLRLIAISAVPNPDAIEEAKAAGAFELLTKPIDRTWIEVLERAIS